MDRRRNLNKSAGSLTSGSNWIPKQLSTEQIQELVQTLRKLGFKVHRKSNHSSAASMSSPLKKRKSRTLHSHSFDADVLL